MLGIVPGQQRDAVEARGAHSHLMESSARAVCTFADAPPVVRVKSVGWPFAWPVVVVV
jgi:hypothetical protein